MIAFGPVPSRRLGRSLGINNIPPKACTYSCIYCQLGRTTTMQVERRAFYEPGTIVQAVRDKVATVRESGQPIDYLTFVSDGEPTLDIHLGHQIELLRSLGIKIAVITNASLLWRDDVRQDLMKADWVSLKVDSTCEQAWRSVNRPHPGLQLTSILDGMLEFAQAYRGELTTETMLVEGVTDQEGDVEQVADFLGHLQPAKGYLSIPTRPPAERWVRPPAEQEINRSYQILAERVDTVEYLIDYEGNSFGLTGDVEEELLSITAVHPMREEAVRELLRKGDADWSAVRRLIAQRRLIETDYLDTKYYTRRLDP